MKLASWQEDFEDVLCSPGIISVEFLNEEESDVSKYSGECEHEECLVNWLKADSWISSWEHNDFEA